MKKNILIISGILIVLSTLSYAQFINTVISVRGITTNSVDKKPIKAKIKVLNEDGKIITRTNSNGKYFVTGLKPGNLYTFQIYGSGYFFQTYDIFIPNTDKYQELSKDFTLKPMAVNAKIPVDVIPFDMGKTKIRTGADDVMEGYLNIMKFNRRAKFVLSVYPENNNDTATNLKFTEERAKALYDYFKGHKIRNDIELKANSETDPNNPLPTRKTAKGKRYKGSIYLVVKEL